MPIVLPLKDYHKTEGKLNFATFEAALKHAWDNGEDEDILTAFNMWKPDAPASQKSQTVSNSKDEVVDENAYMAILRRVVSSCYTV